MNHRAHQPPPRDPEEEYTVNAEVAEIVRAELAAGRRPDVAALAARYPHYEDHVRELVPALIALESLAEPEFEAPRQLGDFRLGRQIGRGGMGVVYQAEQLSLGRVVALKILPLAGVLDSRQIERFRNETRASAQLHHPNIVPIFSVGTERGVHYYAMQWIDGVSLAEILEDLRAASDISTPGVEPSTGPLACLSPDRSHTARDYLRAVARIGRDVADALEHAHSIGIVHRDIKPSNLLLDQSGQVWVADFGLARLEADSRLTGTGDIVGTLRTMSPEQLKGHAASVDHRTDIYSLGATLYEMITLHGLFEAESRHELARRIEHDTPRPLRHWNEKTPTELETIVSKAISKDPADRYASAGELADDLRRFLEDRPILAKRPGTLERGKRWLRRHRRIALTAIAALLLTTLGLAAALVLLRDEQQETQRALRKSEASFLLARQAVDRMLTGVAQTELLDAPGLTEIRHELLESALGFYERFAREREDDPSLRLEVSKAHRRIAELQRWLGQDDEAQASASEAREVLGALDDTAEPRLERATLARLMSRIHSDAGHSAEARREIETALALLEDMPVSADTAFEARALAASCRHDQGLLELQEGDQDAAIASHSSAARSLRELVAARPDWDEGKRNLAAVQSNLGIALAAHGDLPDAERALLSALELLGELPASSTGSTALRRERAVALLALSGVRERIGRQSLARESALAALEIWRGAARDFPSMTKYREALASTLSNTSRLSDSRDEAERHLRESVALWEELANESEKRASYRLRWGMALGNLGNLLRSDRPVESLSLLERSRALCREASRIAPSSAEARDELARSENSIGVLLLDLGRIEEAELALERASAIYRALLRESPTPEYRRRHAWCLENLARAASLDGRTEEALVRLDQSRRLRAEVVEAQPLVLEYRTELAASLHRTALLQADRGQTEAARESFASALREIRSSRRAFSEARLEHLEADVLNSWAWHLITEEPKRPSEATALALEAVRLVDDFQPAWNTLGIAHFRTGELDAAQRALQRSQALGGAGAWDTLFLAMIAAQRGESDRARQRGASTSRGKSRKTSRGTQRSRFRDDRTVSEEPAPN